MFVGGYAVVSNLTVINVCYIAGVFPAKALTFLC